MNKKRQKLIREQLHEIIGLPATPGQIKKFNETFENCKDHYKKTKEMPVDVIEPVKEKFAKKPLLYLPNNQIIR
jgi:hypothetical protein